MTDRPIIFSAQMVRALLHGRKTQTRRLASSPLAREQAGDRLWVREGWKPHSCYNTLRPSEIPPSRVFFLADPGYSPSGSQGRPSIHMPRWASRITLMVEAVRVEPLQDILESDAIAEGIEPLKSRRGYYDPLQSHGVVRAGYWYASARVAFGDLWNSLHGPEAWADNPAVVVLTFRPVLANIDSLPVAA